MLTLAVHGQQPQVGKQRSSVICDHAAPPRGTHWRCDDPNDTCNCRLESDSPGGPSLVEEDGPAKNPAKSTPGIHADDFYNLMNSLASAWNSGNAAQTAAMFSEAAVFTNGSRGKTYKGNAAIPRLFGGSKYEPRTGKVAWHHLLFDEREQIGAGEFTLDSAHLSHGMVIVKIEQGKISNWREYPVPSALSWQKLSSENPF